MDNKYRQQIHFRLGKGYNYIWVRVLMALFTVAAAFQKSIKKKK